MGHNCWTEKCQNCGAINQGCVSFDVNCHLCGHKLVFTGCNLDLYLKYHCATCGKSECKCGTKYRDINVCGNKGLNQFKWDHYFLEMARFVSSRSKDPSTKCGAVIVDENRRVLSTGYNGFAAGVIDRPEWYSDRNKKLEVVVHCEVNAVLFADRKNFKGCTLYTYPFGCCSRCAAVMIQVGLRRFIFPPMPEDIKPRWGDSLVLAAQQFKDVNAELVEISLE